MQYQRLVSNTITCKYCSNAEISITLTRRGFDLIVVAILRGADQRRQADEVVETADGVLSGDDK